jgi:aryl-alcohol dehydrogenase-like predicted oxidoreductase
MFCSDLPGGVGTVQFGMRYGIANTTGQVTAEHAHAMLRVAATAGIDTLDTAVAYGSSEICLGTLGVSEFRVVTKLPPLPADERDATGWVRRQVAGSLSRLAIQQLHGLMLHRPSDLLGAQGLALLEGLRAVQAEGQTEKIGVSVYAPDELGPLLDLHPFDIVQAPLNLIDRQLVASGWLQRLSAAGVEVHVRSAFLQGLLLMPLAEQLRRFPRWASLWSRLDEWRRAAGGDLLAHCLAYPLAEPGVDRVVVGADSPAQLQAIVRAAAAGSVADWPEIACDDEELIYPRQWSPA